MNFRHALGFFSVGAVFALLPWFAPGLFPATGMDGSSTRMIWLQIMSVVQLGLGLSYFAHRSIVGLASLMTYTAGDRYARSVEVHTPQPAYSPQPVALATLSPIRAAFVGGLLDQRRAA